MFKICNHNQPVGTNCIDCIIETGERAEKKKRLYYHTSRADDPEAEMVGILESIRDVGELFGANIAGLVVNYFTRGEAVRIEYVNGLQRTRISDMPLD